MALVMLMAYMDRQLWVIYIYVFNLDKLKNIFISESPNIFVFMDRLQAVKNVEVI